MELALIVLAIFALLALAVVTYIAGQVIAEMRRRDLADRAERNMLLERIQRPEVPIEVIGMPDPSPTKLWRSEADEIDEARQVAIREVEQLEAELRA